MAAQKPTAASADLSEPDYKAFFHGAEERKIVFRANDPYYTFVDVTDAHLNMTGVQRDKLIGRNFFDVFPDVTEKYQSTGVSELMESFREIIRTKQPCYNDIIRYDIPDGHGGFLERYWRPTHYPILDAAGKVVFILQTSNDVTNEVISERDMRQIRDQLQEAVEAGGVGSWVWDIEQDIVVADSGLAKLFGVTRQEAEAGMPIEIFVNAIHPEDRPQVAAAIQQTVERGGNFEHEYRTVSSTGVVRWVLARGRVEHRHGKKTFPGVIVDITERRNLEEQITLARQQDILNRQQAKMLQERNTQLEEVARTKNEFVALASHQLRTPATAVKQYLGMVMQGYVGDVSDLQADMLAKAFESNERQIHIVNQILNAARADTGRLVMTRQAADLTSLCKSLADDIRASVEEHGHDFSVQLPRTPVMAQADLGYIRMAVENLIHNASIYTPEGGTITFRLEKAGSKQARISVTDNGVGIKKADQAKLFDKFSRIHNPLSVQAGGSGIGLYLAAEIVRLHGGSIGVESKLGRGTTFTVSLPLASKAVHPQTTAKTKTNKTA